MKLSCFIQFIKKKTCLEYYNKEIFAYPILLMNFAFEYQLVWNKEWIYLMDYSSFLSFAAASLHCLKLVQDRPNALQQIHSLQSMRQSLAPQVLLLRIVLLLMMSKLPFIRKIPSWDLCYFFYFRPFSPFLNLPHCKRTVFHLWLYHRKNQKSFREFSETFKYIKQTGCYHLGVLCEYFKGKQQGILKEMEFQDLSLHNAFSKATGSLQSKILENLQ